MKLTNENLNLLLVEDDLLQQKRIRQQLASIGIRNIATAQDSDAAYQRICKNKFHLLILDVDLSGSKMNGIELGKKVTQEYQIPILFLSNCGDQMTIQRLNNIPDAEYLLKNATLDQIRFSIQRLFMKSLVNTQLNSSVTLNSCNFFLIKSSKSHMQRINKDHLVYLEAADGGTIFHTINGKHFVYVSLQKVVQKLSSLNMIRVHNKFAIPLHAIETTSEELIGLSNGRELPIGRLFRPNVKELVKNLRIN